MCHGQGLGRAHGHGQGHGRPHDHGGGLGRPHDHRFRVGIVKIFKITMGVPMGVPIGVPTGVPMAFTCSAGLQVAFFYLISSLNEFQEALKAITM